MNTDGSMTSEMALSDRVSNALQTDKNLGNYPISVAAQGSTVTLSGEVRSDEEKDRAEQIARSVDGVIDVTNELTIGPAGGSRLFATQDNGNTADDGTLPAGAAIPLAGGLYGAGGSGAGSTGTAGGAGYGGAAAGLAVGLLGHTTDRDEDQEQHEIRSEAEADDAQGV